MAVVAMSFGCQQKKEKAPAEVSAPSAAEEGPLLPSEEGQPAEGGEAVVPADAEGAPKAVAVESRFDAGTVEMGQDVVHTFKIRNEGNKELRLLRAMSS